MERIITVDRSSDTSFVATNNKLAPCDNQQYVHENCDVIREALMLISSRNKEMRLPQGALLPHRAEWVTLTQWGTQLRMRYSEWGTLNEVLRAEWGTHPNNITYKFFFGPPILNDVIFCILAILSEFFYFKADWRLIQNVYIFNKIIFYF